MKDIDTTEKEEREDWKKELGKLSIEDQLRTILNRLNAIKEEGKEEGIEEKIREVEQRLNEHLKERL